MLKKQITKGDVSRQIFGERYKKIAKEMCDCCIVRSLVRHTSSSKVQFQDYDGSVHYRYVDDGIVHVYGDELVSELLEMEALRVHERHRAANLRKGDISDGRYYIDRDHEAACVEKTIVDDNYFDPIISSLKIVKEVIGESQISIAANSMQLSELEEFEYRVSNEIIREIKTSQIEVALDYPSGVNCDIIFDNEDEKCCSSVIKPNQGMLVEASKNFRKCAKSSKRFLIMQGSKSLYWNIRLSSSIAEKVRMDIRVYTTFKVPLHQRKGLAGSYNPKTDQDFIYQNPEFPTPRVTSDFVEHIMDKAYAGSNPVLQTIFRKYKLFNKVHIVHKTTDALHMHETYYQSQDVSLLSSCKIEHFNNLNVDECTCDLIVWMAGYDGSCLRVARRSSYNAMINELLYKLVAWARTYIENVPPPFYLTEECVICQTSTAVVLTHPCKHLCMCYQCFSIMPKSQCPLCRRIIVDLVIVESVDLAKFKDKAKKDSEIDRKVKVALLEDYLMKHKSYEKPEWLHRNMKEGKVYLEDISACDYKELTYYEIGNLENYRDLLTQLIGFEMSGQENLAPGDFPIQIIPF